MAWNPNIPLATDPVDISQGDIQANFTALDPIFNGINNFIILPIQGSTPTTSASQVSLFSANDGSSNPQLFYGPPSTATAVNLTGSGQATNGWARLPSKILIKWGTTNVPVNALTTVSFPAGSIPAFTSIFYLPFAISEWPKGHISQASTFSLIALGILSTALAFALFFMVMDEIGPARASLVTYINTAVAVLLGVLLLSEPLTLGIIVGLPLVLVGSYFASRKEKV